MTEATPRWRPIGSLLSPERRQGGSCTAGSPVATVSHYAYVFTGLSASVSFRVRVLGALICDLVLRP